MTALPSFTVVGEIPNLNQGAVLDSVQGHPSSAVTGISIVLARDSKLFPIPKPYEQGGCAMGTICPLMLRFPNRVPVMFWSTE
jgi:hypothetical protein